MAAPTKTEVINIINLKIEDNSSQEIDAKDVRDSMYAILDYAEGLDIGEDPSDLDAIYRRKDDSYSASQVDAKISEVESNAPYIGGNGNWFVNGEDTGVSATGPAGADGADGQDGADGANGVNGTNGLTPVIAPNGNWSIGGVDTGVRAGSFRKTDYNDSIAGPRNTVSGNSYYCTEEFVPGSVAAWWNGLRLQKGSGSDYVENGDGQSITVNRVVTVEDSLIFEYEKKNP